MFREFFVHMGMLSEQQAEANSAESALLYDLWTTLLMVRGEQNIEK